MTPAKAEEEQAERAVTQLFNATYLEFASSPETSFTNILAKHFATAILDVEQRVWRRAINIVSEHGEALIAKKWNIYLNNKFVCRGERVTECIKEELEEAARATQVEDTPP